jgi:hypothetical protein|tara:strand:- start:176 stop:352 length:177 start_codon:yes stop_codon:yes gene_type:complete
MTRNELNLLPKNTVVKYAMFSSVLFKAIDKDHVVMVDREGVEKRVYVSLFLRYAEVVQ